MKAIPLYLVVAGFYFASPARAQQAPNDSQGLYFAKKVYQPAPLPQFAALRDKLPDPLFAERPEWAALYWKAWELACKNFHEPAPGSGYVSQFIDAAFNQNIFLWDTCFMTMFCNFGEPFVPGIRSLDNFYAKQYADGEICREIDRRTGRDYTDWVNAEGKSLFSRWGWAGLRNDPVIYRGRPIPEPPPRLTLDALNHPIMAWAECESYRVTADRERLAAVYEPLIRYYRALQKYIVQGNGLYMTDWASMDNSPRNGFLRGGGCAVDTSSQMVLYARNLAEISSLLGKEVEAEAFRREANELSGRINERMWDPQRRFYFDLSLEGARVPVKTIAAFWTLLAGVASPTQANDLIAELKNPATFKRLHLVPTLAADQAGYDPAGGYWCGAIWAPTTTMVVRGLERYGHRDLAREIALNHLEIMAQVFQDTGTIWENYAPDSAKPGRPAKRDFVGWSGLGPIVYLLEFAIGLKPSASADELIWELNSTQAVGCERFRFHGRVVSLKADPALDHSGTVTVTVHSESPFKLKLRHEKREEAFAVKAGRNTFSLAAPPGPRP